MPTEPMSRTFRPAHGLSAETVGPAWCFAFAGRRLLAQKRPDGGLTVPLLADFAETGLAAVRRQYLGTLDGDACYSLELHPEAQPPLGMVLVGLREAHGLVEADLYALAGRAFQIMEWDRTHQFCGHCGTATEPTAGENVRRCPACGLAAYPRLSPAVIVLIERGEEILLARGVGFPQGMWGIIAGFVEPGESLEDALVREVREEVGIEVADLRYWGSQPWPFPHVLMVGFTARYAGGELHPDPAELVEAGWFGRANLPMLPQPVSIARKIIDDWRSRGT